MRQPVSLSLMVAHFVMPRGGMLKSVSIRRSPLLHTFLLLGFSPPEFEKVVLGVVRQDGGGYHC